MYFQTANRLINVRGFQNVGALLNTIDLPSN
jgi:hypothetical protein